MAVTVARLEAILSAQTHDFDRAMDRSEGKMHRVGKIAGIAGAAIVGGLAVGLEKSLHAAVDAETSQNRLAQAFKNVSLSLAPYKERIEEAEAAGRKLGFTDTQTRLSLGSLITATGNYATAVRDLAVAQDIARFKHVQLEDATKMLTMAMTGSQRAAKQLGITVIPLTTNLDKLKDAHNATWLAAHKQEVAHAKLLDKMATGEAVIDAVTAKTHGQAKAFSQTAAGGMEQYHAQLEHLEETIGAQLLPALVNIINHINRFVVWVQNATQDVRRWRDSFIDFVQRAAHWIATFEGLADKVVSVAHALRDIYNWGKKAVDIIKDLVGWIGKIHAPKLHLPDLNPFGDGAGPPGAMGPLTGPKSINSGLYDELAGARSMGLVLTSGYRPGAVTKHGTPSDHGVYPSKAIDVAGTSANMARFFRWLIGQADVKQAFYDPLGSIFGGVLSSYREGGHSDHVHVATYDDAMRRARYLMPGWNFAYNGTGAPEPVGAATAGDINLYVDGQKLFSWFQNAERKHQRRNSR